MVAIAMVWVDARPASPPPLPPPGPPVIEAEVMAEPAPAPKTEAAYRGNTNTRRFHKRGCKYFKCPNCVAKFETREEAIAAGFKACGTCEP